MAMQTKAISGEDLTPWSTHLRGLKINFSLVP